MSSRQKSLGQSGRGLRQRGHMLWYQDGPRYPSFVLEYRPAFKITALATDKHGHGFLNG